ncbi:hypothetical protein B0H17DRAFT_1138290 [Mycena rosella]|uniref:Uncharacterized protein n=1 Tax=Mycena rosella TaxID=1033263 RepID=A0AAD7GDS1_MYCRO|nr:hypothetical protein B0H17DRAFT_1138290 [Mycena rosella]
MGAKRGCCEAGNVSGSRQGREEGGGWMKRRKGEYTDHFGHPLFTQTSPRTRGSRYIQDVFLDYLIYEASQNATLDPSSSARLLVLNTSSQLAYSQGWSTGITLRPGLVETAISLNNSVEGAADLGATVALNFTGSGIEVRGLLVKEFPSAAAAYSLDGEPWVDASGKSEML